MRLYTSIILLLIAYFSSSCKNPDDSRRDERMNASVGISSVIEKADPGPVPDTAREKLTLSSLGKFIPGGYVLLDTASGDLNLDLYPNLILIAKKKDEAKTSDVGDHPEKRPLLLFLGQPDSSYKLVARNNNAILCVDCGGMMGDPYAGMTIKKGYFSIEYFGGSAWCWTRVVTFKYSAGDGKWRLHKDGGDGFSRC